MPVLLPQGQRKNEAVSHGPTILGLGGLGFTRGPRALARLSQPLGSAPSWPRAGEVRRGQRLQGTSPGHCTLRLGQRERAWGGQHPAAGSGRAGPTPDLGCVVRSVPEPLTDRQSSPPCLLVPTALLFKVRLREEKNPRQVWLGSWRTGKVRDIYLTGSRLAPFSFLSPGPIGVRLRDI